ncbi:MAG: potassium/proton antiporter rosb [Myxococcales bacterium]|nr:potassium/proton antiporter rosb [Myxococcales bacterium]
MTELVIVLGTAALVTIVFYALRLPVVLGYIVAGLLIGPHVPIPLVADRELVHLLSELGVILLVFTIGLELRLSSVARLALTMGMTALFEVGFVVALGTLAARILGWPPTESLFAGALLGISSTMLVAKAFEARGWRGGFTELVFTLLVFEDLIAIVLLAILGTIASGANLSGTELAATVARLIGFLVLILAGGMFVVPRTIRWIAARARPETLLITALAVCFAFSALADAASYSVALGAFVAGVLVAESGKAHELQATVRPFRDVFAMIFFVSVGMSIDPFEIARELPIIAVFTVVVLIGKPLAVTLGLFLSGNGIRPAVRAGVSLAQIGELSFVIAGLAVQAGIARPALLAIAVGVSCLTALTTPWLVGRSEAIANAASAHLPRPLGTLVSFYEAWLGRLRAGNPATRQKLRRPVRWLLADAAFVFALAITAALTTTRVASWLYEAGLDRRASNVVFALVVIALAAPFLFGVVRRTALVARLLAQDVIPAATGLDLGRAPRRALMWMLELSIALAIGVPLAAITQVFVPGSLAVIVIALLVVAVATRRSIIDLEKHVRAGSEVILELLSRQRAEPLSDVETMLPGFANCASLRLAAASPAVGVSLADLDIRGRTGATVLAIARDRADLGGLATPSPLEPLLAGDILAVCGSHEAVAAARVLLVGAESTA